MSHQLHVIAEELRRLKQAGVDRVFLEDQTLDTLAGSAKVAIGTRRGSHKSEAGDLETVPANEAADDLRALMDPAAGKAPTAPKPMKKNESSVQPIPEAPPEIQLPEGDAEARLAHLEKQVLSCPTCKANLNPHGKIVFGSGDPEADLFFCGEAPGADEEREGAPFVGKAGQLLDKIIQTMGLKREQVYLANILKWRPRHDKPYGNRPPTNDEMQFCLPYLKAQIEIVQPKVIVALGNTAVSGLMGPDPKRKMGSIRGTWNEFNGTPMMVTFHPSYLLRNGTLKTKRMVWEDLLQVMERCDLPISETQRRFFLPK